MGEYHRQTDRQTHRHRQTDRQTDTDNDDELSFHEGEVINIISEDEEDWWVSITDRQTDRHRQ